MRVEQVAVVARDERGAEAERAEASDHGIDAQHSGFVPDLLAGPADFRIYTKSL